MSETARRRATWDDLVRAPDDGRTYEILDGELEAMPRPLPRHNRAQALLVGDIGGPYDRGRGGPGGWWILIEPDVLLEPHGSFVPDVVGWRRARMPTLQESRPITTVPDWICEITSPKDRGRDRVRKANLYLRAGLPHYWILDPEQRTLEAFAAREKAWLRLGGWTDGDAPRIPPFEEIEIDVAGLLPPLEPEEDAG
jgi:Uma2 family endonuclease